METVVGYIVAGLFAVMFLQLVAGEEIATVFDWVIRMFKRIKQRRSKR